jgi:nucleotide-binding universal stress UspA family protein
MVPLDGSHFAEAALPYALELARKYEAEIVLVSVVNPPNYLFGDLEIESAELVDDIRKASYQHAVTYLSTKKQELEEAGYTARDVILEAGNISEALISIADDGEIDMIVMSTHGRTGVRRWVFGSVAERLLHHVSVPVLLVRSSNGSAAAG